jgi:hypothetical protein
MKLKLLFITSATALLAGCATGPMPGSPQVVIHAQEDQVKNYLVNDLVNKKWDPVNDTSFTITLDRPGSFGQNFFFGSQWNPQTVTRMHLAFINMGSDGTRVIYHAGIITNPDSGWQQQTEIYWDWPQVQYWLNCMQADLEKRPRPVEPKWPPPVAATMRPKIQ